MLPLRTYVDAVPRISLFFRLARRTLSDGAPSSGRSSGSARRRASQPFSAEATTTVSPSGQPWSTTGRVIATPRGTGLELPADIMVPKRNQLVQGVPLTEEEKAKLPPLPYTEMVQVLRVKRVTHVTKTGKIGSYSCLVVSGNMNGYVGMGVGKAGHPGKATENAIADARKHMMIVPRHENKTLLSTVRADVGANKVIIVPKPFGTPTTANRHLTALFNCAGIRSVTAKVHGSRTDHNMVRAALKALSHSETLEDVALKRGKKILDIERQYNKRYHNSIRLPTAEM